MKSQSIDSLLSGSKHIYIGFWTLKVIQVHSIWDLWISDLQKCKGNGFFVKSDGVGRGLRSGLENLDFFLGVALAHIYLAEKKLKGGGLRATSHASQEL